MPSALPVCPTCRYNLTGAVQPRCPECGRRFSDEEWNDPALLIPMPAWERGGHVNVLWAFIATVCSITFRPRRFLRLLRSDVGLLRVVVFVMLLLPATWVVTVGVSFAAAKLGYFARDWMPNYAYWNGHLFGFNDKWSYAAYNCVRLAIHCAAFLATGLALWLPTLVTLDLMFWRDRAPFRLLAEAVLYTTAWWCVAVVFASTIGRAVMEQVDMEWAWGTGGRHQISDGVLPWICWLAAALVSIQYAVLLRYVRSPRCGFLSRAGGAVTRTRAVLFLGWLLAIYLLLLDRHVHLRFHLQFADEQLWRWYSWLVNP